MTHCGKTTPYGPCIRKLYHNGECKAARENRLATLTTQPEAPYLGD